MSGLASELRIAAAQLWRRDRWTSLLILLTFALGLGGNAATFVIARGVVLRPLPYTDPEQLVLVWRRREPVTADSAPRGILTPRQFAEIRQRQRSFSSVAAIESWDGSLAAAFDLATPTGGERLRGALVTPDFFATLGIGAALGRTLVETDSADVAVISHELWQRLFGGASDVIGRRLDVANGRGRQRVRHAVTIVGVLAPRVQFSYPIGTDVWVRLEEHLDNPRMADALMYQMVARLRAGATLAQASDDLVAVKSAMAADLHENLDRTTFWVEPLREAAVAVARPAMQLLSAVAAVVFLVTCLNVAMLLLARTVERRRDIAVRLALGATRWRIGRQLAAEGALLAAASAVCSLVVVTALQSPLRAALPPSMPRTSEIGVDLLALTWVSALVALAIVLSTVLPAWRGSGINPVRAIRQGDRAATTSRGAARWRQGLVAGQVAGVVLLLVGGGLLLHSFWKLQHVPLGFDGARVFTAEVRLLDPRYLQDERLVKAFEVELLARVRALPGVEQASVTSAVPLKGVDWTRAIRHDGQALSARERQIDADYFGVMGIPLLAGRPFSPRDAGSAAPVVILSRSLADRLFPAVNPIGRRLELAADDQPEIVGIVGDVRNVRLESVGQPAYYRPWDQQPSELICLVARTAPGTVDMTPAVRAIVAAIDPTVPINSSTTVGRIVSDSIADRRFYAVAAASFAVVTLFLAAAGLFGVTSQSITARTREVGVRAALGATPSRLVQMLTGEGLRPVLLGLGLGVVMAVWAGRLLERFLFGIQPFDLLTYGVTVAGIVTFSALACLVPALRAAHLSPVVALRHE